MTHASKLDQLEAAFGVLGKRLVVSVEEIGPRSGRGGRARPVVQSPARKGARLRARSPPETVRTQLDSFSEFLGRARPPTYTSASGGRLHTNAGDGRDATRRSSTRGC
jgi:hypothetical protein